jgi:outer membrane protein W
MKYAIRVFALALLLVFAANAKASAQAQEWWWGFTYQTALSAGDTKDFVDQFSWRNVGVEARSMINQNASVGVFFGWNVFNKEVDGTIALGAVDVSGYQSRFINAVPMLVTAHYYLGSRSGPRPYLGAGVGTYWIENRLELGLTSVTVANWHFGLAPEVGVIIPTQAMAETYLSVKYNYAFEANDIQRTYWTFGIGFATR